MKIGDLIYDASIGQTGIIVYVKVWSNSPSDPNEYQCLYEDGQLDWAYENELRLWS